MNRFTALTAYGVPIIVKTFRSRAEAKWWASTDGQRYGVARIVMQTASGPRTIWRQSETREEAA